MTLRKNGGSLPRSRYETRFSQHRGVFVKPVGVPFRCGREHHEKEARRAARAAFDEKDHASTDQTKSGKCGANKNGSLFNSLLK